jgi:hypothetical protein
MNEQTTKKRRYAPNLKACWNCNGPLPEGKGKRYRVTCSDKCRQARYRRAKGQVSWQTKRGMKESAKRRALPFIERRFNVKTFRPVYELGYRRDAYECVTCGRMYEVERITSGQKASPYCSTECRLKANFHWGKLNAALELPHVRGKVDPRVVVRMEHHKLSPLCPNCSKPFAPNTTLDGERLRGRPRKWCSDACRKEAYEKRWKRQQRGKARGHRYRDCLECGTKIDREDTQGRRIKRFCRTECRAAFMDRARQARDKQKEQGVTQFKRGASGHGSAARRSTKNRRNTDRGNELAGLSSGKAGEKVRSGTKSGVGVDVRGEENTTFIGDGVLETGEGKQGGI